MKPIIVVATDEEYKLAQKRFKRHYVIQTGVGGINVIRKLKHLPKWKKILNFGYAGSNKIPIGTEISIGYCMHIHPGTEYHEPAFVVNDKYNMTWCYTSDEFVKESTTEEACVYDMELAYILALGFKNVKSIKIISDNLNEKEYENKIEVDGK